MTEWKWTLPMGSDASKNHWVMGSAPGPETILNGRRYLYFAGTGYLGLQSHPELIEAAVDALRQLGTHSATSRSGFGDTSPVRDVERLAARFLGADDAIYLASGYATNQTVCAALAPSVDVVLIDDVAHDSLRESIRWFANLSKPPFLFQHRNPRDVERILATGVGSSERVLLMTDGVFPVSGLLAPLAEYATILSQRPGSMMLVDDAHGLGVLGENGRGSLEHVGISSDSINVDEEEIGGSPIRFFRTGTLSKAIGGHGGIIAGSRRFIASVRSSSGWFRAASGPAASVAAATAKGLEIVLRDPALQRSLAENVMQARSGLRGLGIDTPMTPSPIIGITLGSRDETKAVFEGLLDAGIAVGHSADYTGSGPHGTLRIAIFANHTREMIDRLLAELGRLLPSAKRA